MAITDQKEYEISFGWLVKFSESLEELQADTSNALPPLMKKAMIEQYKSQIASLENEIQAYANECTERRKLAGLPPEAIEVLG